MATDDNTARCVPQPRDAAVPYCRALSGRQIAGEPAPAPRAAQDHPPGTVWQQAEPLQLPVTELGMQGEYRQRLKSISSGR